MKNSNKAIVLAMLFVNAGNIAFATQKTDNAAAKAFGVGSKQHLDRVRIQNDSNKDVNCELTWKDRNNLHTLQVTAVTLKPGKSSKQAGPELGWGIFKVAIYKKGLKDNPVKAGGNKYFVITKNGKVEGYKNEGAYKASLVKSSTTNNGSDINSDDSLTA